VHLALLVVLVDGEDMVEELLVPPVVVTVAVVVAAAVAVAAVVVVAVVVVVVMMTGAGLSGALVVHEQSKMRSSSSRCHPSLGSTATGHRVVDYLSCLCCGGSQ